MNKLKRNIKVDYFYKFFTAFDITAAIWILYLGYKGLDLIEIGLLESIFHITGLVFEIPTGALADLLGRKKVIIIGRVSFLISCIIMIFANSFIGFACGFIVQAISYNLNSGSEEALVYDSLKSINEEESYTKVCGRINLIIEIAQGLAVFIGGLLAEQNFVMSYIAAILVGLCSLGIAFNFKETPIVEKKEKVKDHFKECLKILKENKQIVKLLMYFPWIFAFSTTTYFYSQQHFSDLGFSKVDISVIFLMNGVVSSLGALLSDKVEKRLNMNKYLLIPICMGMATGLFAVTEGIISLGMFWLVGLFTAMLYPIGSNKMNELIPSEQRATIISIDSMMFSLAMIIFFPVAGFIGEYVGLKITFIIIGAGTIIFSCVEIFMSRKNNLNIR